MITYEEMLKMPLHTAEPVGVDNKILRIFHH